MKALAMFCCAAMVASAAIVDNFRPAPIPPASQARIREIASMLPEKPGMPGGYSQDRQTWERLARLPEAKEVIERGESALAEPIPELSDEGYLEFNGKGDRARYQKPFGRRSTLLKDLLLAECLERKGRFLPKICTCIDAICSERSWTLPAHDEDLGNFNGNKLSVDLASGARAFLLATTLNWLGGSIPSAMDERVRAEISRRVFAPYLKTARGQDAEYRVNPFVNNVGNWWFAFPNNWNAVCHSCVVRTALAIVEDREARAEFVEAAERTRESYLDAFTPDGYCDEGMGYWNYGYGHELSLGLFVRRATGGKVDFFKHSKDRNIMLYPYGYMLEKGKSPHFADGGGNPNPSVLALGRQVWPDIVSSDALDAPILACSTKRSGSKGYNVSLEIIALRAFGGEPPRVSSAMPLDTLPIRTFFPDAQVLISRTPASGAHHFAIAMKGGHNAELHNHNDVGSYALMLDGDEIAGDPGGEIYTRRTFSPRRYESKVLSSYAHPVPYPAGTLQSQGRSFAGKVLKADFSDAKDVYSLDLKGAYEVPGLLSLVRTLEFDRARMRAEIADEVAFESPSSFAVPVITYCEVEKGADGRSFTLLSKGGRRVKVSVSATGGEWRLAEEIVKNPGRSDVRRLAVEMVSPVKRAAVKMSFEAQLAPAGK
jgi:hypothetical protein